MVTVGVSGDKAHFLKLEMFVCFTSTATAEVTSGQSVILLTLMLGKPPLDSLSVFSAHSFAIN